MRAFAIVIIIALIAVILGYFIYAYSNRNDNDVQDNADIPDATIEDASITVLDQPPGDSVIVSSLFIPVDGFVEIHEEVDGDFGAIVSESEYLTKGSHNNVEVTLKQPFSEGTVLYAMLHSDDGDGVWDQSKDLPLRDKNDQIVMKQFKMGTASVGTQTPPDTPARNGNSLSQLFIANENAVYIIGQRPGNSVRVTLVKLSEPGFAVVHESENGEVGNMAGSSRILTSGMHDRVPVTLNKSYPAGSKFVVTLHVDDGDRQFEETEDQAVVDLADNEIKMDFEMKATVLDDSRVQF